MDRIIEVKVGGNYITKDSKNAGVRGEANVTVMRIAFDEGWDGYAKSITFWDAHGENPVKITLTTNLLENKLDNTRVYLVPIPSEPMAEAGTMTFVIDGYTDGKRQRSVSDTLEVKYAPEADDAGEPTDPTPTQAEQLQKEIDGIIYDIQNVAQSSEYATQAANSARQASASAVNAQASAERAEKAAGKASYIGENGNWYAWDSEAGAFYDTGVKAQAGSTVYCGDNPPDEADVWIYPEGDGSSEFATNEYVDNLVGDIETALDEIISIQNTLIGGDA